MAEQHGSVYAEIRLQLDQLAHDITTAKNKFATLSDGVPTPEIRANITKLQEDIKAAKTKLKAFDKLKVHPPEVRAKIDELTKDIDAAKAQLKEFGKVEVETPELRLAMEKLEQDIATATAKKKELEKVKVHPPEVRLGVANIEADIAVAQGKIDELRKGVTIPVDFQKAEQDAGSFVERIKAKLNNLQDTSVNKFGNMAGALKKAFAAAPIVAAIGLIVAAVRRMAQNVARFLNETTDAFHRQQAEVATLNAVLESTGATAWTSASQLDRMATSISSVTGRSLNEVRQMQTRLLTYNNIIGENFDRTAHAAADMAAVMGMTLPAAAELLGRALDQPVQGLTALSRQGFRFNEVTQEQIRLLSEQGRIAEAQAIILREVETAYAGAAAAQENATGNVARLANAQEELRAELGAVTAGITNWHRSVRIAVAEGVLFELRQRRIGAEARASEDRIHSLTEQISRLRDELAGANDQRARQILLEIEGLEAALNAMLTDVSSVQTRIDAAQADYDRLMARHRTALQGNTDALRNFKRELDNLQDEDGRITSVWGQHRAQELNSLIAGVQRNLDRINNELRPVEARLREARAEMADIEAEQAAAVSRQEEAQREMSDMQALSSLTDAITAAEVRRADTIQLTQRALAQGRIDQEEAQRRIQGAYTDEANSLERIRLQILEIQTLTETGETSRQEALNRTNRARQLAVQLEQQQLAAIQLRIATEQGEANIAENMEIINRLETERRGNAAEILALEKEIALEKLRQEEFYRNAPHLQAQMEAALIQRIMAQRSTESEAQDHLRRNEIEYQRLLARREGNLERLREIERQAALERLQNDAIFRFASEETQSAMLASVEELRRASASAELIQSLTAYQRKQEELGMNSRQLLRMQREESLRLASAFSDLGDEYDQLIRQINAYYDELERRDAFNAFVRNALWATGQAVQLFNEVSNAVMAFITRDARAQQRRLDERNNAIQRALDEELQMRLHAAGFASAITEEQHLRDLEHAIATGDHLLIYQAEQARQRWEIENDIAQRREQAEKDFAMERARIDYETAKAQWRIQMLQAAASTAQAILVATASAPWPFNLPGITFASGIGVAQKIAIGASKPRFEPPAFAHGGIVPGNSFRGDRMVTLQNSGEMDINRRDQQKLWNAIKGGNFGGGNVPVNVTVVMQLDGRQIAETSAEVYNNGIITLQSRAVAS